MNVVPTNDKWSRKDFIFPKVIFDETKENLVTTKENKCRFRMKNFTKEANFFKGICKKPLLMISKFIDLGSLMVDNGLESLPSEQRGNP